MIVCFSMMNCPGCNSTFTLRQLGWVPIPPHTHGFRRSLGTQINGSIVPTAAAAVLHIPIRNYCPISLSLSAPSDRVPPIIRQGPANQTLAPGTTTQLHCHIMGNPTPSIQWEKDGQRILGNSGRISLMENGTFQITNLQVAESGTQTALTRFHS